MARIRTIKPEIWVDEKLVECTIPARLLFIGLLNFADDDGRMEYRPKKIKMQVYPADSLDIEALLGELRREKVVKVYVVDGKEYLQISGFAKHQKVDKRSKSRYPGPEQSSSNPAESPRIPPTEKEKEKEKEREKEVGEREDKSSLSPARPPTCPHVKIIQLYHDTLPELPRIMEARWPGSKSETALRARWTENPEHQDLDFWRELFEVVKTNPHWMGRNDREWKADLHWIVTRGNFDKIMTRWANLADAA